MKQLSQISSTKSSDSGSTSKNVVTELQKLKQTGELEKLFHYVVLRLGDYKLICDETSALFFDDMPMSRAQIKCMVRRDMRNNGMVLSTQIFKHIFSMSLKFCVKVSVDAMRSGRYEINENGVYAPKKSGVLHPDDAD
jgi:hypothetical protein